MKLDQEESYIEHLNGGSMCLHVERPLVSRAFIMDSKGVASCEQSKLDDEVKNDRHKVNMISSNREQTISKDMGKENQDHDRFCFACNRSLARSKHLINISGQNNSWHPECFKCNICHISLDEESSCHLYKDKIVCREDYIKLQRENSIRCSRCRWQIAASDWVRKAGDYVYHLACFSCDICLRQLSTGEQFTISVQEKNTVRLLCRLHFAIEKEPTVVLNKPTNNNNNNNISSSSSINSAASLERQNNNRSPPITFDYNVNDAQSPQLIDRFQQQLSQDQYLHLLASTSASNQNLILEQHKQNLEDSILGVGHHLLTMDEVGQHLVNQQAETSTSSSTCSTSGLMGMPSKSKRVRTTFTEDQLSILQTHFQIDSNPDGQDLERIATITGLSKRVTQVWFQNSRARQKKYMIKRKPTSVNLSSVSAVSLNLTNGVQHNIHQQFGSNGLTRQQLLGEPISNDCCQHDEVQEQRWSKISNRSELSVDGAGDELEAIEDSRSSDDHLILTDESEE